MSQPPPDECANCGTAIPPDARACPGCGADERSGWREASPYDGLNLPDEAWADHETHAQGTPPRREVNGVAWHWWLVAVVLLALLVLVALRLF